MTKKTTTQPHIQWSLEEAKAGLLIFNTVADLTRLSPERSHFPGIAAYLTSVVFQQPGLFLERGCDRDKMIHHLEWGAAFLKMVAQHIREPDIMRAVSEETDEIIALLDGDASR